MFLLLLGYAALAQTTSDCKGGYDIYWVLDHSSSVTTNFDQYMIPFVQSTTSVLLNNNVKTSLIWFGNDGHLVSPLTNNAQTIQMLLADKSKWTPPPGPWGEGTNTASGLALVEPQVDRLYNSVVFLVTDGCTNQPYRANTLTVASRLQQRGAEIYFIYVPSPSDTERCPDFMNSVASAPIRDHYLQPCAVESVWNGQLNCYSQLNTRDFIQTLVSKSCLAIDSVTPTTFCGQSEINVTVRGQGFLKTSDPGTFRCLFGSIAREAAIKSDTELQCITPPLPTGSVTFEITRNGVTYTRTDFTINTQSCPSPPPPVILNQNASLSVSLSGPPALTALNPTFSVRVDILNNGAVAVPLPLSVRYDASGRPTQMASCPNTADYLAVGETLTCSIVIPLTATDYASGITVVVTASVLTGKSRPSVTATLSAAGLIPTTFSPVTSAPSKAPSRAPTLAPRTLSPSRAPSRAPTTRRPTRRPSRSPTQLPTYSPTRSPNTRRPTTRRPTNSPIAQIVILPITAKPTPTPSLAPSASTLNPSTAPSSAPSVAPSVAPSAVPSAAPTVAPSSAPSQEYPAVPSVAPSSASQELMSSSGESASSSGEGYNASSTEPRDFPLSSSSGAGDETSSTGQSSGAGGETSSTGQNSGAGGETSSTGQGLDVNASSSSSGATGTDGGTDGGTSGGTSEGTGEGTDGGTGGVFSSTGWWHNDTNITNITNIITAPPTSQAAVLDYSGPVDSCKDNKLAPRCIPWWGWLIVALGVTAISGAIALLIAYLYKASAAAVPGGAQPLPNSPAAAAVAPLPPSAAGAGAAAAPPPGDGPVVAYHFE